MMESAGCLSGNDTDIQAVIDNAEIQRLFAPLRVAKGLVLAVSGGPDSLALMLLAARWRELNEAVKLPPIYIASVDHALRPEASDEAHAVKALASDLGFSAQVLVWQGDKPMQAIQEMARTARYQLLIKAARDWGASHVVTAHHRDDQAETVLMRLANGSGIGGLGAMRPMVEMPHDDGYEPIILARPLLTIPKDRLLAIVNKAGLSAVDDPSNRNIHFTRVRLRHLVEERNALGLSVGRLVTFAQRCNRADMALATIAAEKFAVLSTVDSAHDRLHLAGGLWIEPEEIILRCIAMALRKFSDHGSLHHVPLERLERLMASFTDAKRQGQVVQRTLHGMIVCMDKKGMITVSREPTRYRGRKTSA